MFGHEPVLLNEIVNLLPSSSKKMWMLDATFGRGGHTKIILAHKPSLFVIALDRDQEAVEWSIKNDSPDFFRSVHLLHGNFHEYGLLMEKHFSSFLKGKGFDIILLDLGVSSMQLDQAERGFSFYKNGPLDMRMDRTQNFSAKEIINDWNEKQLRDLFYSYGEIYHPGTVVKEIIRTRKQTPFHSTKQLSALIEKKVGWKKKSQHPATPYFLALRLRVNDELDGLKQTLPQMIASLNPKGRLFVLSFHSLEDRIVKQVFQLSHKEHGIHLTKKVIQTSRKEIQKNQRARSAKLRVFEKRSVCHA